MSIKSDNSALIKSQQASPVIPPLQVLWPTTMFPTRSLLFALTWVLVVTANPVVVIRDPPISVPLVKKLINEGDGKNIVERDLARLEALERRGSAASITATRNLVNYLVNVSSYLDFPNELRKLSFFRSTLAALRLNVRLPLLEMRH